MTVKRVPVGEILKLERRAIEVVPDREYAEIGVRSFGRGIFHKEPVSGASLGAKRVFRVEPGDLVISNVFAWEGAVALAGEAEAGMVGSHRFMTFVPKDGRIDPSWATWYFRSEPGLTLIRKASPGSAGRNRTLAIDRFASLEIPLPPIDEQRACSAQLAAVADAAELASRRVGSDNADLFSPLLPGLVDTIVRLRAVESIAVSDAANFVSDTVHPGDDAGPAESFVGLQHIESHTGRRLGSDDIGLMKGRKFRFQPGDILYGYLRPYLNKVWLADRHGLCSVDQYVLRPKVGVSGALLAYCLRGRGVLTQAIDLTHRLQLPRLRSGLLRALEVPVAPDADVEALVAQLDALRDRIVEVRAARRHQQEIVRALVPAALNDAFAGLS